MLDRSPLRRRAPIALLLACALLLGACSRPQDGDAAGEGSGDAGAEGLLPEVAAEPTPGCRGPGAGPRAGEQRRTLEVGGEERWYLRRVPPAHDGRSPLPVVVDLHGYNEGAELHARHTELGTLGDREGFITLTPQGRGEIAWWQATADSPDIVFIDLLLTVTGRELCTDARRVFVTGLSNGAFMASALACALPDRIAAVAPVAGIRPVTECPEPDHPVPAVAFHGTDDRYVSYSGGLGDRAVRLSAPDGSGRTLGELGAESMFDGPAIEEVVGQWARRNRCGDEARWLEVAEDVHRLTRSCPPGAEVELYRIDDGGHTWPGSTFSANLRSMLGSTTMSVDASAVIWEFFRTHPLR